jgi:hypothetical protein
MLIILYNKIHFILCATNGCSLACFVILNGCDGYLMDWVYEKTWNFEEFNLF